MEIIIYLLAIFGLTFALKEANGPWNLFGKFRNLLFLNKWFGSFFYELFSCYFCLGFHSGWIIYLLYEKKYHLNLLFLWGLAGAAGSLILDVVVTKLNSHDSQE